jgi:hypothetical protein
MHAQFSTYTIQRTDTVTCHQCGNVGVLKWDCVPIPGGVRKEFVGIVGDFYERLSKKSPHPIELVCTACNVVVQVREIQL